MPDHGTRRTFLRQLGGLWAVAAWSAVLPGRGPDPDHARLERWVADLRRRRLAQGGDSPGPGVIHVGELARGTPYEAGTLDAYLRAGGDPTVREPLVLSLMRFDCVTLVESCLAVARVAAQHGAPSWERLGRAVERMRYRGGEHRDYASRLHYFSEWIRDGAVRGLVRDLGPELGGEQDPRPLRFMTAHRRDYPALTSERTFQAIAAMERRLDGSPRWVIPTARIPDVADRIEGGDVLAFATALDGLDVTHAALAYRDQARTLRVLHAPLSGGVVEVAHLPLPEYVAAIRHSTGVLVARPLPG